jgi:hypothetical protein
VRHAAAVGRGGVEMEVNHPSTLLGMTLSMSKGHRAEARWEADEP